MTLATKIEDVRFYTRKEALEEGRAEGRVEGRAEGRAEGERSAMVGLIKRLLEKQKTLEEIADICGLDLDEIKKIAEDE